MTMLPSSRPARRALILSATLCAGMAVAAPARAQDREPAPEKPGAAPEETAEHVERRTQEIQKKAAPAVVEVRVTALPSRLPRIALPGLVLAPYRARDPERVEATAFFVTPDGHIVTTSDAVRSGSLFEVRFADGTLRDATLVGFDDPFRLAVLRTAAQDTSSALAAADDLEPGRRALGWVLGAPATSGASPLQITCVRAATRSDGLYDRYLTSSMSLAPGGAGSPLLSEYGNLLGMAVGTVANDAPAGANGTGGARSSLFVRGEDILRAVDQITKVGRVKRARLGVMLDGTSNRVDQLLPGGPAEIAGLREGDVVTKVAGVEVQSAAEISRALLRRKPGEAVAIDIHRGADDFVREIVLDEVAMPPLPATPPIEGAVVEMTMAWPQNVEGRRSITFIEVAKDSAIARAGVRVGDALVSVDGMDARRYMERHRIRPAEKAPAVLVVNREGEERTISIGR